MSLAALPLSALALPMASAISSAGVFVPPSPGAPCPPPPPVMKRGDALSGAKASGSASRWALMKSSRPVSSPSVSSSFFSLTRAMKSRSAALLENFSALPEMARVMASEYPQRDRSPPQPPEGHPCHGCKRYGEGCVLPCYRGVSKQPI